MVKIGEVKVRSSGYSSNQITLPQLFIKEQGWYDWKAHRGEVVEIFVTEDGKGLILRKKDD